MGWEKLVANKVLSRVNRATYPGIFSRIISPIPVIENGNSQKIPSRGKSSVITLKFSLLRPGLHVMKFNFK